MHPFFAIAPILLLATLTTSTAIRADELGEPRSDLTAEQLEQFYKGRKLFTETLPGLGPLFNDESCAACHFSPTVGGSGSLDHVAFIGPRNETDVKPYPRQARPGWEVPERNERVKRRIPPPLYGLGLVEQIPDETIRATCKGGHTNTATQTGRLPNNKVARFGVKPFVGTLEDFVGAAASSESGVSSPLERYRDDDEFPDPEVDIEFIAAVAAYIRGLQPPSRNGNDVEGEKVFRSLGCVTCHVPDMAPANGVYSDFCLHQMGAALADGIRDHEAQGDEFRTAALWGLRFRTLYLHDGRATTLHDAISAHGGQAAAAASAYANASDEERAALMRFLRTL